MKPIEITFTSSAGLKICEKYQNFFLYIYPMLINMSGNHRVLRDKTLEVVISQFSLFNDAAKSNQASRLHMADSGLSTIRDHLRILSSSKVKLLSLHQYSTASALIAEVGLMLGAWIIKCKKG